MMLAAIAGMLAGLAVDNGGADADRLTEFANLQQTAQAFASTMKTDTGIDAVAAAFGTTQAGVDQPCSNSCSRVYWTSGGKTVPFHLTLIQHSSTQNSDNYHYDTAFLVDQSLFQLVLNADVPRDLCFSETSWNDALTRSGWEQLQSYDTTLDVEVSKDRHAYETGEDQAAETVAISVHGFATRRGDTYLTLSTIAGSYWNTALMLKSDLDADQAIGDCLRTVIIDGNVARVDYDLSRGGRRVRDVQ